jgi:hypothetical protein
LISWTLAGLGEEFAYRGYCRLGCETHWGLAAACACYGPILATPSVMSEGLAPL